VSAAGKKRHAGAAEASKPQLKLVQGAAAPLPAGVPQYLTVSQVAVMLRCKPRTIYQMVSQRRIPFRKAGRQLLFDAAEIDRWTKDSAQR
jgi:excisionase family DNA binding protein